MKLSLHILDVLFKESQEIVLFCNERAEICFLSPLAQEMLGPDGHRSIGQALLSTIHPADRDLVLQRWDSALQMPDQRTEASFRLFSTNGVVHPVKAVIGNGLAVEGFEAINIHCHREDAHQMGSYEKLAKQFSLVLDNSSDVIALYDGQMHLQYISPSIQKLLGYSVEEILSFENFYLTHPEDVAVLQQNYQYWIDNKVEESTYTYRIRHKNGDYLWVEVKSKRNFGESGALQEAILNYRSIHERVVAEKLLKDSESRYRMLVMRSPIPIVIHDTRVILFANPATARTIGATSGEELIGTDVWSFVPKHMHNLIKKRIGKLRQGEPLETIEIPFKHTNGHMINVSITGLGINFLGDFAVFAVFQDISEKKAYQNKLEEQNKALESKNNELDRFVYSVTHDLRSPINSALSLIDLCLNLNETDEIKHYLDIQKRSLLRLIDLINDLLELAQNKFTEIRYSEVDVATAVEEVFAQQQSAAKTAGVELSLDVKKTAAFYGDPHRIYIVLSNLIANAIRYHNPYQSPSFVRVRAWSTAADLRISITDNGIGILKEHQNRLFEMFYRIGTKEGSTGLGLYITKLNVEKMGGTITLASEQGQGSCFTVSLPNHRKRAATEPGGEA